MLVPKDGSQCWLPIFGSEVGPQDGPKDGSKDWIPGSGLKVGYAGWVYRLCPTVGLGREKFGEACRILVWYSEDWWRFGRQRN